jgi:hypothetical protein
MLASKPDVLPASSAALALAGDNPVHIIFHIPRCAGQTAHRHLAAHAANGSYHRLRKRKGASRLFLPRYQIADMPDPQGLAAISGHWIGRSIERHFGGRQILRSLLLRDPVSQFVSHYNFRMMRYLSQGMRPYAVEIAYRARERNFITHFILRTFAEISVPRLLSLSATEKFAEANRFLSDFWFVGDYTRCDELIAALAPTLGVPTTAEPRNTCEAWQQCVRWTPLRTSDLSARMIDQIKQDNILDQLLWETWRDTERDCVATHSTDIGEMPLAEFVVTQSLRLFYQVRRRFHRGWKVPSGTNARSPVVLDGSTNRDAF